MHGALEQHMDQTDTPYLAAELPRRSVILRDELDILMLPSSRAEQQSAWHGHVSFGHWIVQAVEPKMVVELGTHNGVSFASFCKSVVQSKLHTQCFAIDTWEGDAHAGHYGEHVYQNVATFIDRRFSSFAKLMRCYFDDALSSFAAGSVDLLHIDGLHTYEAVKHDFDTWLPKLSDRGVVLFHDIAVHRGDFGVWRLWEELTCRYPNFSFEHASGLGVLAVGAAPTERVAELCASHTTAETYKIRRRFEQASQIARMTGLDLIKQAAKVRKIEARSRGGNIALDCIAWQSSFFSTSGPTPGGAVNGIKTGGFGFHTAIEDQPWWMVDLGENSIFDEVIVYNRLSNKARARSLVVLISTDCETWTELYAHEGAPFGGLDGSPLKVRCPATSARFVKFKLRERQILHLDEVEIISSPR